MTIKLNTRLEEPELFCYALNSSVLLVFGPFLPWSRTLDPIINSCSSTICGMLMFSRLSWAILDSHFSGLTFCLQPKSIYSQFNSVSEVRELFIKLLPDISSQIFHRPHKLNTCKPGLPEPIPPPFFHPSKWQHHLLQLLKPEIWDSFWHLFLCFHTNKPVTTYFFFFIFIEL